MWWRRVLTGASGGLIAAGTLGATEAVYHLATQGMPDTLAPAYGVVLYGLIGAGLGLGGGALGAAAGQRADGERTGLSWGLGAATAVGPMLLFVLHYLANKVVYAEQGVPLVGKLVLLGGVGALALALVVAGRAAGAQLGARLAAGSVGAWAALAALAGAFALAPLSPDPRASFGHDKPVPAALADAPNVLIVLVDTLRADHLGAYGYPGPISPTLDRIAADGVVFEDAIAHASWTRSSIASLWTSRLPAAHRADRKASRLSDDLVLFSEVARDAGVTTANLANNINVTETFNFDQGFDSFVYEAPAYHFGATESVFSLTFYKVVHKLRERLGGHKEVTSFYQPADVVLADARAFIEANRDSRWLLGVHLMEPHDPYFEHPYLDGSGEAQYNGVGFARAEVEHPELSQAEYLRRVYADEVRHMDRLIEPFVAWLKQAGHYDDTLIVITADHGEEFGEHGGFWHGTSLYEEQIHVPLIVKLPGSRLAGTRVRWQARQIDVAPTVTAALGLAPDPSWEGRDLLGDVERDVEERVAWQAKVAAAQSALAELAEAADAGRVPAEQLEQLQQARATLAEAEARAEPCADYVRAHDRVAVAEQDFEGNVLSAVRLGGLKLIRANDDNPRGLPAAQLFDLRADPGEQRDLNGSGAELCGAAVGARQDALGQALARELERARSGAVEAEDVDVDASETCNLCALGYLSGPQCDDC